jgi:hypothetical protein
VGTFRKSVALVAVVASATVMACCGSDSGGEQHKSRGTTNPVDALEAKCKVELTVAKAAAAAVGIEIPAGIGEPLSEHCRDIAVRIDGYNRTHPLTPLTLP